MQSIPDLISSAGFIFSGTVIKIGDSTVPSVPRRENLAVVRVDRALRVDPVLGDLRGKMITVAASAPETLSVGQRAIFFTNSWVHGGGIAVREVEHLDIKGERLDIEGERLDIEDSVASAVAQLPQLHLLERLRSAQLVVDAQVAHVSQVARTSFERNVALWAAAELKVERVLRGKTLNSTVVYFPTSDHPMWASAPRFKEGQQGIFILHAPNRNRTPSEATLGADSLVALDTADFQPESQRQEVEELLSTIK